MLWEPKREAPLGRDFGRGRRDSPQALDTSCIKRRPTKAILPSAGGKDASCPDSAQDRRKRESWPYAFLAE